MEEIVRSVRAAWRLAMGDAAAASDVDASLNGFWRSFRAAFISAIPVALYAALLVDPPEGMAGNSPFRWIIETSGYALQWTVWPFVMFFLSQALGKRNRFLLYAASYNWLQVITTGGTTALTVLVALLLGKGAASLAGVALLFLSLFLEWRLTRETLELDAAGALLIVIAGLFTLFLIAAVTNGVLAMAAGA